MMEKISKERIEEKRDIVENKILLYRKRKIGYGKIAKLLYKNVFDISDFAGISDKDFENEGKRISQVIGIYSRNPADKKKVYHIKVEINQDKMYRYLCDAKKFDLVYNVESLETHVGRTLKAYIKKHLKKDIDDIVLVYILDRKTNKVYAKCYFGDERHDNYIDVIQTLIPQNNEGIRLDGYQSIKTNKKSKNQYVKTQFCVFCENHFGYVVKKINDKKKESPYITQVEKVTANLSKRLVENKAMVMYIVKTQSKPVAEQILLDFFEAMFFLQLENDDTYLERWEKRYNEILLADKIKIQQKRKEIILTTK